MGPRLGIRIAFALLAPLWLACLAAPAQAQAWRRLAYPGQGFAIQFPAEPTITQATYLTASGAQVPATRYEVKQDGVIYSVTVADLSKAPLADQGDAIAQGAKAIARDGAITLEVEERVDREHGRELSIVGKDGGRALAAVFFKGQRLYQVVGLALPPDAPAGAARTVRFQQSLQFIPGEDSF